MDAAPMSTDPSRSGRRSLPWRPEELLYVDGMGCTYTTGATGVLVHLPGRIDVPLTVLKGENRAIIEPKRWRFEHYV